MDWQQIQNVAWLVICNNVNLSYYLRYNLPSTTDIYNYKSRKNEKNAWTWVFHSFSSFLRINKTINRSSLHMKLNHHLRECNKLQLEKNLFVYYKDLLAIRFTYIKSTGKKSLVLLTSHLKEAANLSNSRNGSMVHEMMTSLIMLSTIFDRSLYSLSRDSHVFQPNVPCAASKRNDLTLSFSVILSFRPSVATLP